MTGLHGLDVIVDCHKKSRRTILGADAKGVDDGNGDNEMFEDAVTELFGETVGFGASDVSPYLSAFAKGFDHGPSDADKKADEDKAKAKLEREKAAAESSKKTTIWVVVGLGLAALVGGGIYLGVRKKK